MSLDQRFDKPDIHRGYYEWQKNDDGLKTPHYLYGEDEEHLTRDHMNAFDWLGEWQGVRWGDGDALWETRLSVVQQFVVTTGRFP